MRAFIVTIFMATLAGFFGLRNAMAVTVTNTAKCIVTPCAGTDCQYDVINSVSSQCTSITYTVVKHIYDTSADAGKEYGVYADCSECPSGYYVSDSKASLAHSVCGQIQYYKTCALPSRCQGTPQTTAGASTVSNCASASKATFGKTTYYTCNTCNSGYTRTAVTVSDARCTNTTTKYTCEKSTTTSCDSSTCVPDPDWTCGSAGSPVPEEGVCLRNYRGCNNNACVVQTIWQCQDGWYGSPATNGRHCTKCPESADGATVHTSDTARGMPMNSNTTISKCYVNDGKDATGKFEYITTSGSDTVAYSCYYSGQ